MRRERTRLRGEVGKEEKGVSRQKIGLGWKWKGECEEEDVVVALEVVSCVFQ